MTWNYRVMKRAEHYAIYEVFYNEDGTIKGIQLSLFIREVKLRTNLLRKSLVTLRPWKSQR